MTLISSPLVRTILVINVVAVALGLIGNLAPGVAAKVAGTTLFFLVIAGPGLILFSLWQMRGKNARRQPRPPRMTLVIPVAAFVKCIALAIGVIFVLNLTIRAIGEPGTSQYPATATRVFIISLIGLPFLAFGAILIWRSMGPRQHYYKGASKLAAGSYELALHHFQLEQHRQPDDPASWEEGALCLVWLGRGREALASADRGLELRRRWQGLYARGVALMWCGATHEARQDLEECASIRRGPLVDMFIGALLVDIRLLDSAIAVLKAVRKRVRLIDASLMLGDAYRLRGMDAEAIAAYTDAAALAGRLNHVAAMPLYAYALARLERFDDAIEVARPVLEGPAFRDVALRAQALATMRLENLPATEQALRELMERSPHLAVQTFADPDFTHLLADERFKRILGAALTARDELLAGIRNREQ